MGQKLPAGRKNLSRYEGMNLLFFLSVILALGVFVSAVFLYYRGRPAGPAADDRPGILSENVVPGIEACMFSLGTKITETNRRYVGVQDISVMDDGLVRDLFAVPGVTEVVIDRNMIMLHKTPSAEWERIQPGAREVINRHLHMHP
jgi:hypothetical protein